MAKKKTPPPPAVTVVDEPHVRGSGRVRNKDLPSAPATKNKPIMPKVTGKSRKPAPAPKKNFSVGQWSDDDGEKIIIYAESGMGKTTLSSMAPTPVFIGLDDGGRKIKNPLTGERLSFIQGVETFQDVLDVLRSPELFGDYETIVIDNVTVLQDLSEPYMFRNVPGPKGSVCRRLEDYGYNKGYKHMYDTMKLILCDCDALVRAGKNIILIAQSTPHKVSNPGGEDFLRDGPRLYAGKPTTEAQYCEWADHIFRIDYLNSFVKDKKVGGDTERVIYTEPQTYFRAKSRTLEVEGDGAVSFAHKADDSIWKFLFGGE